MVRWMETVDAWWGRGRAMWGRGYGAGDMGRGIWGGGPWRLSPLAADFCSCGGSHAPHCIRFVLSQRPRSLHSVRIVFIQVARPNPDRR